ncbi:MAG: BatA domain-containing protein [Kiritimatiellia bacterium]
MTFLSPALLIGLAGLLLPVAIHLLFRRTAKRVDWGAMRFLRESVVRRHRWMRMQEFLLMFLRILVPVAAALAMARPFLPPGSGTTTLAVAGLLLGAAFLGALATVTRGRGRWASAALAALAVAASFLLFAIERKKLFSFLGNMGEGDWVIVIDASPSMTLAPGGESLLDRAVNEAKAVVEKAPKSAAFSIVRGGPVPEALVLQPTRDRDVLLRALSALQPAPGGMDAIKALSLASVALAEGANSAKGVLVLTDTHRDGWNLEHPEEWSAARELFDKLPGGREHPPLVRMVSMTSPGYDRNLSLNRPRLSRDRIGTDRPVQILADLENNGREAATARRISLVVDGRAVAELQPPTLNPGEIFPVRFSHRFPTNGFARATLRLDADDSLPFDNSVDLAVPVVPPLRALLVESRPQARRSARAAFFLSFALKPGKRGGAVPVEADVMPVEEMDASPRLESYDVIVLSDLPRLPPPAAGRLRDFVARGGGLLLAPGPAADTAFYNEWISSFCPAGAKLELGAWKTPPPDEPLRLAARAGRPGQSGLDALDAGEIQVFGAWDLRATGTPGAAVPLLRFQHGEPCLSLLFHGQGRLGVCAMPLDATWSNFPAHPVFIPVVHGVMDQLAGGASIPANLPAAWNQDDTWRNPAYSHGPMAGAGLVGVYSPAVRRGEKKSADITRLDSRVDFEWQGGAPARNFPNDSFRVRWTGFLRGRVDGEHRLNLWADDRATVKIAGKTVMTQGQEVSVTLSTREAAPIEIDYEEENGNAACKLLWALPGEPFVPVPASAFSARPPDPEPVAVKAANAAGELFRARWFPGARQCRLAIDDALQPGFYSLALPAGAADLLEGWLPPQPRPPLLRPAPTRRIALERTRPHRPRPAQERRRAHRHRLRPALLRRARTADLRPRTLAHPPVPAARRRDGRNRLRRAHLPLAPPRRSRRRPARNLMVRRDRPPVHPRPAARAPSASPFPPASRWRA